jgi:pilus assembly protein CpaB
VLKNKSTTLLLVAVGAGILAALLAVWYLKAREADLRARLTPNEQQIEVVVANRDLTKGTTLELDPKKFAVRTVPREYVHTDAVAYSTFQTLQGKKLVQNLGQGKILLRSFIEDDFPRDFSDTIPLKRRAMTVQVDEVNSVNGFVRPGNRIDILVNLPGGVAGSNSPETVMPVLENVEVLATGRESAAEYEEKMILIQGGVAPRVASNYTSITVNVTPREAALLETAQDKGDLLALLRNRKDTSGSGFVEVVPTDLREQADLLAREAAIKEASARLDNQGLVVGEDGIVRTKDGVALKDQNLVVREDGTIMTKDGVVLSGRGLTINEKGELVTADGTVVDSSELVVAADGSLMTKDGKVLGGRPSDTRLAGKALGSGDLVVREDGTVMTKDGQILAGVKMDANGKLVDENGNPVVVTESGAVLRGVTTNEKGEIVLADGTVVAAEDLIVADDGTVMTRDGQVLAGVQADTRGIATAAAGIDSSPDVISRYDFLAGGVSDDGVAKINKVPYAD